MKGKQTIKLKGEEIEVLFTVGVLEDTQEFLKEEGYEMGLEEALNKMELKPLRFFISKLAEYAGNEIKMEDVKFLPFEELMKCIELINQATGDLPEGKGSKGEK